MGSSAKFASTPRFAHAVVSAANTNRDGTGTLVDIITGVADGTMIYRIRIQAIMNTTAGMVRLFLNDGTNSRLFREVVVSVITVAASTPGFSADLYFEGANVLILPSASWKLQAATHNAESFIVSAQGGDLT